MFVEKMLEFEIWGNTGESYLKVLGVFVGLSLIFYLFQKLVVARVKKVTDKTQTDVDDFVLSVIGNIHPPFYLFVAFYIAIQSLVMKSIFNKLIYGIFLLIVVVQVVLTIQKATDYILRKKIITGDGDENRESMIATVGQIFKWALWIIGALLILSNLGVDVTSLIAGLGIGGIAIALAAQNVLGDVFASFSIYIDKPFEVGDFIKVGDDMGTVIKIGVKTTRIKTLRGNEVSIPNKKLTDAELHNFTRMESRRKIFTFGVTYETSVEKLRKIKIILEKIFESFGEKVELERVHFKKFGESSLDFEVSFKSDEASFSEFMDIVEEINFEMLEKFNEAGIGFAYPTQMIHLNKNEASENIKQR